MPASARIKIDATELQAVVRDHAAALADAAQELGYQARALLDFIPPEVNPIVITRERVDGIAAAAQAFVALLKTDTHRTTADIAPGDLEAPEVSA